MSHFPEVATRTLSHIVAASSQAAQESAVSTPRSEAPMDYKELAFDKVRMTAPVTWSAAVERGFDKVKKVAAAATSKIARWRANTEKHA